MLPQNAKETQKTMEQGTQFLSSGIPEGYVPRRLVLAAGKTFCAPKKYGPDHGPFSVVSGEVMMRLKAGNQAARVTTVVLSILRKTGSRPQRGRKVVVLRDESQTGYIHSRYTEVLNTSDFLSMTLHKPLAQPSAYIVFSHQAQTQSRPK